MSTAQGPSNPGHRFRCPTILEELDLTAHFPTLRAIGSRPAPHVNPTRNALAAIIGLSLLAIGPTAQEATAFVDHLEVALWPEFDKPAMLVIYRFELAPDTSLPAQVALPIPAAVGQPHAVAWLGEDGVLYDAAFILEPAGDWSVVQIELTDTRTGQLEYYSAMDFAGIIRSFLFEWPSGFELGGLSYKVQEPVAASDLIVNPAPDREVLGDFGLNYLTAEMGPQAADSAPVISVTYEKASTSLSVEALQPLGETPVDAQSGAPDLLPWLILAAGITILGGGAYYLASRRQPAPHPAPKRRRKRAADVELEASTVYCHQCGAAAGITDVYCRQCGTQLRK